YLPRDEYRFVELVERGRPDWLESACRQDIRCDALIISGHFDGGDQFYTDRLDAREFLPVAELERASCSDSCPGVFSQLKEVYLFGCNTLNAEPTASSTGEAERSFIRSGYSPADSTGATPKAAAITCGAFLRTSRRSTASPSSRRWALLPRRCSTSTSTN